MTPLNILVACAGMLKAGSCCLRKADVRGNHLLAVRNGKIGQCLGSKLESCIPCSAKVVKPLLDAASPVHLEELCIALWVLPPQDERYLRAPEVSSHPWHAVSRVLINVMRAWRGQPFVATKP